MTDVSTCYNLTCRATAEGIVEKCPQCGSKLRSPKTVRRLGWILLSLGLFLIIFMGVILFNMTPMLLHPGEEIAGGSSFTGDAGQAKIIFALLYAVIGFGVGSAINGGYQIKTGRRSMPLTILTVAMAVGLLLFAWYATGALKS